MTLQTKRHQGKKIVFHLNSQLGATPMSTLSIITNGVVSSETDPRRNGSANNWRMVGINCNVC